MEYERPPVIDDRQREHYDEIVAGLHADGDAGRIAFAVSTDDLDAGRGDLFVALGLAKYLARRGWGVRLWPMSQWGERLEGVDAVVSMLESFVPGLVPPHAARIAWVRNWTETWLEQPFLREFDAVWSSSSASAEVLAEAYGRAVDVVPIAADAELFSPAEGRRGLTVVSSVNHWGRPRRIHSVLGDLGARVDVTLFGEQGDGAAVSHVAHAGRISYFGLPDVYRRSLVVLDDVIEQAAVYGNQNSRLFESISAGALPVTNTRAGLDELGLDAVPTYSGAEDLAEVVERFGRDLDAFTARTDELSAVVRERHTFEVRAAETEPLIRAAIGRAEDRAEPSYLFAALATERAGQIYTSTISDIRLAEIERRDRRIDDLERAVEAAEGRIERLNSTLFDAWQELEAQRRRKIARVERSMRGGASTALALPGRVRSALSRWSG
ncbi:hypothetical protein N1028_06835 [Herbiconiux sp. CPCC 203407]|uniref:Spore protein YkvP/CgeB glycosyl transferase-like domain-containing protein n=1 Tax=Herbiconiux oxytropis TaxID=2970915 RepID=A0AA41XG66_9MICO|nr:glycosyltransferase [Herbiconiux oxytropis]MCS5722026.1 hypothetical protein [Herbiconiux oxytropis]MCS5725609.1 hypothetical protein [Herbiconiux oxytropis]